MDYSFIEGMVIMFDLDNTILITQKSDYANAVSNPEALELVNFLYDHGAIIKLYTARYQETYDHIKSLGFKFHKLYMSKPGCHVFLDDKSLFYQNDWGIIKDKLLNMLREKSVNDIY